MRGNRLCAVQLERMLGAMSRRPHSFPGPHARDVVARHGHVAERRQLVSAGVPGRGLGAALHRGDLIRVRRGWYATPAATAEQRVAVRIGGQLGGPSAAASYGLWVPSRPRDVYVSLKPNASRLRPVPDGARAVCFWSERVHPVPESTPWRVDVRDAIAQSFTVLPHDEGIALADSALHGRIIDRGDLEVLLSTVPATHRLHVTDFDHRAESGIESLVRRRLHRLGIACRIQVQVEGVGRVDLVIGDRLVIEVDGAEHHSGVQTFASDRRRDLELAARGYRVLRLSYRQVMVDWEFAADVIQSLLHHGEHRGRARL